LGGEAGMRGVEFQIYMNALKFFAKRDSFKLFEK
jgi:hypothetical protein